MQTILGTFDDRQTAQRAVDQLVARGFTRASIHLQTGADAGRLEADSGTERGMMASVGHFFATLFESDDKTNAGNYVEAVRRGSSVVAVDTSDDSEVQTAESVMGLLGTINMDDRAEQWKIEGWSGFDPNSEPREERAGSDAPAVSVVEEGLLVGKRTVDTGGLRVVKRISETPVTQIVNLRQEKATIERKPVDREATEADFSNFKEGTFEIRETAEEAVIGKTANVVEEVSIGREVTDRDETVSDTVRRTNVDVERIPGTQNVSEPDRLTRKS